MGMSFLIVLYTLLLVAILKGNSHSEGLTLLRDRYVAYPSGERAQLDFV